MCACVVCTYTYAWYVSACIFVCLHAHQGSTQNINLEGQSKSLWILRGSGGMLPQENFENLGVNILNFGEILL